MAPTRRRFLAGLLSAVAGGLVAPFGQAKIVAGQEDCGSWEAWCAGACVDTSDDADNCGSCGASCPSGASCWGGSCQCDAGELCGSSCKDLDSDPGNCGQCDYRCGSDQICQFGSCSCPDGLEYCGTGITSRCVDLSSNPAHCGFCGAECASLVPGSSCRDGECRCPPDRPDDCAGGCTDVSSDPSNCGACGNACGTSCTNGACTGEGAPSGGGTETAPPTAVPPTPTPGPNPQTDFGYTSPRYGFTLTWDDSWEYAQERSESLQSSHPPGRTEAFAVASVNEQDVVTFTAWEMFEGDARLCLEEFSAPLLTDDAPFLGVTVAKARDGEPVEGGDSTRAYAAFQYHERDSTTFEVVYLECRTLVPGEAVLLIDHTTLLRAFAERAEAREALLAGLVMPGQSATPPEATSAVSAPDATTPTPALLPDDEPVLIETPADEPILIETPADGVNGTSYTSPTYRYTLSWDPSWAVVSEASRGRVDRLNLTNQVSTISFTAAPFEGDAAAALQDAVATLTAHPQFKQGVASIMKPDGQPLEGRDTGRAWAVYQAMRTDTDDPPASVALYVDCRTLVPGQAILTIVQEVALDAFNSEDAARRALLSGLVLPEQPGAAPVVSPTDTPVPLPPTPIPRSPTPVPPPSPPAETCDFLGEQGMMCDIPSDCCGNLCCCRLFADDLFGTCRLCEFCLEPI